jgi:hypothetical protein
MSRESQDAVRVIHYYIADLLLDMPHWLNHTTGCSFPAPWGKASRERPVSVNKNKSSEPGPEVNLSKRSLGTRTRRGRLRPLRDYTGIYRHPAFGTISLSLALGGKALKMKHGRFGEAMVRRSGDGKFLMNFVGKLRFFSEADGWNHKVPVLFHRDKTGTIKQLTAVFIEESAPPVFTKGSVQTKHTQGRPSNPLHSPVCRGAQAVTFSASLSLYNVVFLLYISLPY